MNPNQKYNMSNQPIISKINSFLLCKGKKQGNALYKLMYSFSYHTLGELYAEKHSRVCSS